VLGDLYEEYLHLRERRGRVAADLWYAAQVFALGLPWAFGAVRRALSEILGGLRLDLRSSLRGLRRQPALIAVSVLSLSLGSGLVTAAATMVNGAWYAPLPWTAAERMVDLADTHPTEIPPGFTPGTSLRAFQRWRTDLPQGVFERLEAHMRAWVPIRTGEMAPSTVRAVRVSGGYGDLLELEASTGRLVSPADLEPGADPVVVLSDGLWRAAFGESPDAIGRTLDVDGVGHTVIGVLRPDARTLEDAELLLPLSPAGPEATYAQRGVQVLGVLAEGVSVEAADAALASLASGLYADAEELTAGWSASATPLRTVLARRGVHPMGAVALVLLCLVVLLVAALNLASLLLARTTGRAREFGVRAALGAGTARVARASLMDGLILAGAGGALGLAVVVFARDAAVARFAAEMPSWASFPIDLRVLVATVLGTTLTALLVGLLPVLRAVAIGRASGIARSAVGQSVRSSSRGQNLLLGGQIVLALALVAASAGALRTFSRVSDFDRLGYRWEGLTGVVVSPVPGEEAWETARAAGTLDRTAAQDPRVQTHATARSLRLAGADRAGKGTLVRIGGLTEALSGSGVPSASLAVGPGYFGLNEIPILAGRAITEADGEAAPPAAVISTDAARAMWPDRAPESVVGELVELERDGRRTAFTVVGVSGPVILDPTAAGDRTVPRIYPSILQTPDVLYGNAASGIQLQVSTAGAPPTLQEWTAWVNEVLPGAQVSEVFEVEGILRQWVQPIVVIGSVLGVLAMLVLALVAIGIYGTVSYRIASTRREIGIRLALGADARQVVGAVLRPIARVVVAAVVLGGLFALASGRVLAAGGIPVGPGDAVTLALGAILMFGAAAGASWGPLRRALAIDPSQSLREE
jgi:putative ABC transport system permease protein